jgi:hypothetical protein
VKTGNRAFFKERQVSSTINPAENLFSDKKASRAALKAF